MRCQIIEIHESDVHSGKKDVIGIRGILYAGGESVIPGYVSGEFYTDYGDFYFFKAVKLAPPWTIELIVRNPVQLKNHLKKFLKILGLLYSPNRRSLGPLRAFLEDALTELGSHF
jgi:hypothetical protein